MAAKKTVKSVKPKAKSSSSGKLKDLLVKKTTAVKGGLSRNMYRRSQMSDPCDGEE